MKAALEFFVSQKQLTMLLCVLSLAWLLAFFPGLTSAANVWWTSEIFHHCAFVLPISAWLIYLKRQQLMQVKSGVNYFALPLIILLLLVQVFGVAGDIKLLQYIATFAVIPCLFLFFMGFKACLIILFPLFFLIFAIPVGDEFIPLLQQITADISVFFLNLTGISIFRDGLYIEIPNGKFVVAEACSGISFLIVSIVFGSLYAYLYLQSVSKKLLFIGLTFFVPIMANALRVMGIVIIGDVWGMEYAGGTDHLIYGGVFYCFVLFLLIIMGEKLRDKQPCLNHESSVKNNPLIRKVYVPSILVITFFVIGFAWQLHLKNESEGVDDDLSFNKRLVSWDSGDIKQKPTNLETQLVGYSDKIEGVIQDGEKRVEVLISWYSTKNSLMAFNSHQRLFNPKKFRVRSNLNQEYLTVNRSGFFNNKTLENKLGKKSQLISYYNINGRVIADKKRANLIYAWLKILNKKPKVIYVVLKCDGGFHPEKTLKVLSNI